MVELLLAGGVGTTASLVSQALVWLYQHQDVRADLIEHPDKVAQAVEEFLRYVSPTQALARTVARDTEFHGCTLREGDRVLLAWASANRDAAQFSDPDTLDIERWPNRHTAFGVGIHRCAGSHLGRAMAIELLGQILQRMPDSDPQATIDRLAPLAASGNPWRPSALELTALARLKLQDKAGALDLFKSLADDPSTPQNLRARAAEMATALAS